MKALALVAVALALAAATAAGSPVAGPAAGATAYLAAAQRADGGFGEAGRPSDATLTAWAALGLVAGGAPAETRARALGYLRAHENASGAVTDVALAAVARLALGDRPDALLGRLRSVRPGPLLNAEIWTLLALLAAGDPSPQALVRDLLAAQAPSGGWSWARSGAPDSNDTAAALQALRAAGVRGTPIARGLSALRAFRRAGGGYGLTPGREPDAQSTAWVAQALIACGVRPARATWRFLARLRRPDGSYRYSARYATTPVWVTAQVVPALAGKPYPLR